MPCILKVRIISARNLPVMDRTTDLTDAFVEVKFAEIDIKRTPIIRKSLNPVWNEDFRFEIVHDSSLQNEPLEMKVMDYDQISYNDAIGSVFIDLNPLLTWDSGAQISGWFPIYDTLLGIRGELNAQIKLQFFGNKNPFKDSSAGVQFYTTPSIPFGFQTEHVFGFVSAITNQDDPEYHWTDSFRTPRFSNESRTKVMFQLSGQIRRMVGKKVLELQGNAVIGFKQYFDYEEEQKTITVRAIGTACKLYKERSDWDRPSAVQMRGDSVVFYRGDSSVMISQTPEGGNVGENGEEVGEIQLPPVMNLNRTDPVFLTMIRFPKDTIIGTGGLICATSIKVLDNDDRDVRELWWTEVRDEIKSHARTVNCSYVIGYTEQTSIVDDVMLLYCSGTAVNIDPTQLNHPELHSIHKVNLSFSVPSSTPNQEVSNDYIFDKLKMDPDAIVNGAHITYRKSNSPFPMALKKCKGCRKKLVPEVLLSTAEPPVGLQLVGSCVLIEAHVCRPKKIKVGDSRATIVSESIPFLQYDIHRQLMYKLRIYGLNAVFGLRIQISVGENILTAVATGTAIYVQTLPTPPALKVFRTLEVVDDEDKLLLETQQKLMEKSEQNRRKIEECLQNVEVIESVSDFSESSDESDDEPGIGAANRMQKKSMVIEIDDEQDEDLVLFLDDVFDDAFQLCNIDLPTLPWLSTTDFQMITMVKQKQIDPTHHPNRQLAKVFKAMYQELKFQMSYMAPCSVTGVSYSVEVTKSNCVMIYMNCVVTGNMVLDAELLDEEYFEDEVSSLNLEEKALSTRSSAQNVSNTSNSIQELEVKGEKIEIVGSLDKIDEDPNIPEQGISPQFDLPESEYAGSDLDDEIPDSIHRPYRPSIITNNEKTEREHIELTPLSTIPNATSLRFLGRISLHFIKESSLVYDSVGSCGLGGFCHVFLMELLAIVKAHVLCLGGNAVVGFELDQIHLDEAIKTQGYAMVSVSGDVVQAIYDKQERVVS